MGAKSSEAGAETEAQTATEAATATAAKGVVLNEWLHIGLCSILIWVGGVLATNLSAALAMFIRRSHGG